MSPTTPATLASLLASYASTHHLYDAPPPPITNKNPRFIPALDPIPSPPLAIPATYKQDNGEYFPNPPSPPVRLGGGDIGGDFGASKKKAKGRSVRFSEDVAMTTTYASEEYGVYWLHFVILINDHFLTYSLLSDRTSIVVTPLTQADIPPILRLRAEMHRVTTELYQRRAIMEEAQEQQRVDEFLSNTRYAVRWEVNSSRKPAPIGLAQQCAGNAWKRVSGMRGIGFQPCF